MEQKLLDIRNVAEQMGLDVLEIEATTGRALEFAFTRLRNDPCDAIYVASGPLGRPSAQKSFRWPRTLGSR